MKQRILILDGANLIYRARYSFSNKGDYGVIYSFFRSLRPLVERHQPDRVYFVLEGTPVARIASLPTYKANRVHEKDESFNTQRDRIIEMLQHFPVTIIKHSQHECDDVIAHLARKRHCEDVCTIISSDTDFIQLASDNCHLYNPIKKKFISRPDYDYLTWKALRGDACDNIPGLKGVGDKTATRLVTNPGEFENFFESKPHLREHYLKNLDLIGFEDVDATTLEQHTYVKNLDIVKSKFTQMGFVSIINERPWNKFEDTFRRLQ